MTLSRRHMLAGALAAPAILYFPRSALAAKNLKISHQFPGGTLTEGDFRDRLCRKFADELSKRTNGELGGEVYPNASLVKTNAQFSAVRKGALDMSLYPLAYAGGEVPETNIGLMPCLVSSYAQGAAWTADFDPRSGRYEFSECDLLERDFGREWVEEMERQVRETIQKALARDRA